MQNIYYEVNSLDDHCVKKFGLSSEVMMEHAALGMKDFIMQKFERGSCVLIVCGAGNNGADGLVLARQLQSDYAVKVFLPFGVKSELAQLQYQRAQALGITFVEINEGADILVDALFGSGFSRSFDTHTRSILQAMNSDKAYKIACDIPSGLHLDGSCEADTFYADTTITMGALKQSLYLDGVKDLVGEIKVADLGVARYHYEDKTNYQLLDFEDIRLPHRNRKDTHKGSFGHLAVLCGEKSGAAVISALSALNFGAGLVSLVSNENVQIPYEIMQSHLLPNNSTAIALGMGLGNEFSAQELENFLDNQLPLLLDADIFYSENISALLKRENMVITPHPKEFVALLSALGLAEVDIAELQSKRFKYVELFSKKYPNVVLLLKGANVIIAYQNNYYINPHGSNVLAKGGSGDVLSGLIGALLAQGYTAIDAAISASLAHTLSAKKFMKNSYALTPKDLIEGLKSL